MRYHREIAATIKNALPKEKRARLSPKQITNLKNATEFALILAAAPLAISLGDLGVELMKGIERLFYDKTGKRLSHKVKQEKVIRTVYYLKEKGFIRMKRTGYDFKVILTKLGKKRAGKIDFENLTIPKSNSWDKKWWQVAADIPTKKHKRAADLLRAKLKEMGFFPLQRTLWFYPYDPREEINEVANHYQIGNFVTVMEINRLDRDDERRMKIFFRSESII